MCIFISSVCYGYFCVKMIPESVTPLKFNNCDWNHLTIIEFKVNQKL